MDYSIEDLKKRIKDLKKEKGINSEGLSEMADVPIGTLNKLLGSATRDPSITTIIKIAHALGVTADYLIFGEESNITADEHRLLSAYRAHPEMQPAVNKMLDIKPAPSISDDVTNELTQDALMILSKQKQRL